MSGPAPVKERAAAAARRMAEGLRRLEALARLDARTLARSYAPGKWNGIELLAHLADSDHVTYYRFLKVVAPNHHADSLRAS